MTRRRTARRPPAARREGNVLPPPSGVDVPRPHRDGPCCAGGGVELPSDDEHLGCSITRSITTRSPNALCGGLPAADGEPASRGRLIQRFLDTGRPVMGVTDGLLSMERRSRLSWDTAHHVATRR
jgi:hypothetical protein